MSDSINAMLEDFWGFLQNRRLVRREMNITTRDKAVEEFRRERGEKLRHEDIFGDDPMDDRDNEPDKEDAGPETPTPSDLLRSARHHQGVFESTAGLRIRQGTMRDDLYQGAMAENLALLAIGGFLELIYKDEVGDEPRGS